MLSINTNIAAEAVNLCSWLSGDTNFAVPAYQRNYRWDTTNCETLLNGIVKAGNNSSPYFIGSILSKAEGKERTLIDGQQRLITLMILLAALYHSDHDLDKEQIKRILYHPYKTDKTRVRPFKKRERYCIVSCLMENPTRSKPLFMKIMSFSRRAYKRKMLVSSGMDSNNWNVSI